MRLTPGSYRQGRVTALLSWSGTHKAVAPPKYSTMRVWAATQSGNRCVSAASA